MIKKINLLLLISIFANNNFIFSQEKEDNTAAIAVGAAAGAVAGFGLYNLFSAITNTSDKLVEDACKDLMVSKQFAKQLEVLDCEFQGLTNVEKRELVLSIDEDLADQLAPAFAINSDLKQNIKNLKYYQSKFPKRIRKLQRQRDCAKYKTVIDDMSELVSRIDKLLPRLEYLSQYYNNHQKYFDLDAIIESVARIYSSEFKAIASRKIFVGMIKNAINSKFRDFEYPLIEYIIAINADIAKIDKYISYTNLKYPILIQEAQSTKNKLRKIYDIITTDREYFAQKRAQEDQKTKQAMINAGSFLLGAATGAIAASISNEPKKEEVIVEEEVIYTEPETVVQEEIIIEE